MRSWIRVGIKQAYFASVPRSLAHPCKTPCGEQLSLNYLPLDYLYAGLPSELTQALAGLIRRQRISPVPVWESIGCDDVRDRSISRLGARIRWICYSKGEGAVPSLLVTVLYGADWRAASIDLYSF